MTEKPKRFKDRADLSIDEELAVQQAARRGGSAPRFETDEYRKAKREALEAAGLEVDDEEDASGGEPDLEALTPDEHFQRITGRRA